jgi:hypothetical protein
MSFYDQLKRGQEMETEVKQPFSMGIDERVEILGCVCRICEQNPNIWGLVWVKTLHVVLPEGEIES